MEHSKLKWDRPPDARKKSIAHQLRKKLYTHVNIIQTLLRNSVQPANSFQEKFEPSLTPKVLQ
jgi:hypothetical protein